MLTFFWGRLRIELHFLFVAVLLFACMFDPARIALLGIVASALHEMGHFVLLWWHGCKPSKLSFELAGITVVKSGYQLPPKWEALVLLSGSSVNLLGAALCVQISPVFAMVQLLLGVFNLLPFPMLDGGKLLKLWLDRRYLPERAAFIELIIQIVFLIVLSVYCILSIQHGNGNWMMLITVGYLFSLVLCGE